MKKFGTEPFFSFALKVNVFLAETIYFELGFEIVGGKVV
jgi:hypothetical protein